MAFPFPITNDRTFTPEQLKDLREALICKLLIQQRGPQENQVNEQLAQITQVLSQRATIEPTAYENGAVSTSATGTANILTQQVDRAVTQVLGRAPGRGADGFMQALNGAFPTAANGKVMHTPARSVVSLYSPYGESNQVISGTNGTGLTGQLSVEQANLYRQASVIGTDALRVLAGLQPFDPTADMDAVEALRSLVHSQINTLVEEFGRLYEPRPDRVNTYFKTLLLNLTQLGDRARLSTTLGSGEVFPVTADDQAQVAALDLLNSYVTTLIGIWSSFLTTPSRSKVVSGNYSERLTRVSILLPVIADSNATFMAAMDSVGFTESERRSNAASFRTICSHSFTLSIDDPTIPDNPTIPGGRIGNIFLPDITVNDFNEWVDRFATIEAPSMLANSGRFGLDFVTDQADTLFWVIGFVLDLIKRRSARSPSAPSPSAPSPSAPSPSAPSPCITRPSEGILETFLKFERVSQTLNELVFQLDTLAGPTVD